MQRVAGVAAGALIGGVGEKPQRLRYGRQIRLAGGGEGDGTPVAVKQGQAQPVFQRLDGMTDGAGRDAELLRGNLEFRWRPAASNRRKVFNGGRQNFI
jgi:hypothetical protein